MTGRGTARRMLADRLISMSAGRSGVRVGGGREDRGMDRNFVV